MMEVENKNNFKIEFTKGDTYALQITLKNANESARIAHFTVKDAESGQIVLQKTLGQGISETTARKLSLLLVLIRVVKQAF